MTAKQAALYTMTILATLGLVAILLLYPEAVVMFLFSLAVAAAARPMVDWLVLHGMSRGVAVLLTYLGIIALFAGILFAASVLLVPELKLLGDRFVITYDRIWVEWPNGTALQRAIIARLPQPEKLYEAIAGDQGQALAQGFLGWTSSTLGALSQVFAVLVLSIYWTIDQVYFERLWLSLLAVETRARWREIGRQIERDLGAYIRSELSQSVLALVMLAIGFTLIDLPYPILFALYAAFVWLIPWLGAVLAVVPVVLVGFSAGGWLLGVGAGLMTAAVLLFQELVIEPRLFTRRQYGSWLTILFLMALGESLGLAGVLLAPPLAAVTQIVFRRVFQAPSPATIPATGMESARQIARLDERIETIRAVIANMEEKPSQQTEHMLERLDALVERANGIILEQNRAKTS